MIATSALADTGRTVEAKEVSNDAYIVAELLDYIRWLTDLDSSFRLTSGHIWALYHEGVRRGRVWSEICEDIDLPVRKYWSS